VIIYIPADAAQEQTRHNQAALKSIDAVWGQLHDSWLRKCAQQGAQMPSITAYAGHHHSPSGYAGDALDRV